MLKTKNGVGDGIRTRDDLSHSQVLYQAELHPPCYFNQTSENYLKPSYHHQSLKTFLALRR